MGTKGLEVVLTWKLEVLAILKEGAQHLHYSKAGGGGGGWRRKKCYPGLKGGRAQKVSDPRLSHFVAPLPVINDQIDNSDMSTYIYVCIILCMYAKYYFLSFQQQDLPHYIYRWP